MMEPANSLPTDTWDWLPMTMSMMLGGIRMPRVPPAQMQPLAKRLSYPYLSMTGMARSPMVTTEAPMMPVQAPKRVETTTTATAMPPLIGPKR